jgi:hypothetical protein
VSWGGWLADGNKHRANSSSYASTESIDHSPGDASGFPLLWKGKSSIEEIAEGEPKAREAAATGAPGDASIFPLWKGKSSVEEVAEGERKAREAAATGGRRDWNITHLFFEFGVGELAGGCVTFIVISTKGPNHFKVVTKIVIFFPFRPLLSQSRSALLTPSSSTRKEELYLGFVQLGSEDLIQHCRSRVDRTHSYATLLLIGCSEPSDTRKISSASETLWGLRDLLLSVATGETGARKEYCSSQYTLLFLKQTWHGCVFFAR